MNEGISFLEAKTRLEKLCAYQERCSFELERRMIKWGISEDDRNALLAHLISQNFLSEERYAKAFASGKHNIKKWGRTKIKRELKARRISDYSIRKGLEEIDDELYLLNLRSLFEKKMNSLSSEKDKFKRKAKLSRYLFSKGYESDLIIEMLNELD